MRYLFFDLEYATSKGGTSKICEFGYVLTNETFNVIERGNLIINPCIDRLEWDYRVVNKILTRKISEYESYPSFYYYEKISSLISNADYVVGHSLDGDAKALNDDCKRYGLPSIDYSFYDVKLFYKEYKNSKNDTSVSRMLEELNINGETREHDAECDSFNTMLELKGILDSLDLTFEGLLILCPNVKNENKDYVVKSIEENYLRRFKKFKENISGDGTNELKRHGENRRRFLQFMDNVKPIGKLGNAYTGKKVSISINYEENHYRQMLNLVQLVVNQGGRIVSKASLSDVYVKYDMIKEDGTLRYDSKLKYVEEANNNGSKIEIISFDKFLMSLNLTKEQLDSMPMVSFDFIFEKGSIIKDKKEKALINYQLNKKNQCINKSFSEKKLNNITLGDLFGDVFKSFKSEKSSQ